MIQNSSHSTIGWLLAGLLIATIAAVDFRTGEAMAFSNFYLPAILVACWYLGVWAGLAMALLAAGAGYSVNEYRLDDGWFSSAGLRVASVQLTYFFLFVLFFVRVRHSLDIARRQATKDSLTGLANHCAFREAVELEIQRSSRYGHGVSVAYIDCDDFKTINDTLGHRQGDRVLVAIADSLCETIRANDIAARVGGDEFAILFPEADALTVRPILTRLRAKLDRLPGVDGRRVSLSIGIATTTSVRYAADELIQIADASMYAEKLARKQTATITWLSCGNPRAAVASAVPSSNAS